MAGRGGRCHAGRVLLLTERQLRYWHDSQSLFTHTLEVEDSRQHTLIWEWHFTIKTGYQRR